MITEGIIKQKFIFDAMQETAESVYRFQFNSFRQNRKSKTGDTFRALSNPDFSIKTAGDGDFIVTADVTKQLRLQDLGFRSLYTRPLYGALKHLYGRLRYGLSDEIRNEIHKELENALM